MNLGLDIYFAVSISGGREYVEYYRDIADYLGGYGRILNVHITDRGLTSMGEQGVEDTLIHDRDMEWLDHSKILVAEVTQASLGVGYEIGRIDERNLWVPEDTRKHILCLYQPQIDKRLSAMIKGSHGVTNAEYQNPEQAFYEIDRFFHSLRGN